MISLLSKIAEHQISTATPTAAPPTSAAAISTTRPTAASQVVPIHVEQITPPLSVMPPLVKQPETLLDLLDTTDDDDLSF